MAVFGCLFSFWRWDLVVYALSFLAHFRWFASVAVLSGFGFGGALSSMLEGFSCSGCSDLLSLASIILRGLRY